ncbi:MAG: transcription termination/antitermination NusG family protein [Pseudomonadota bacterium]
MFKQGEWNVERVTQLGERNAQAWHALMAPPGREIDAALILDKLGVTAYAPHVKMVKRAGRKGNLRIAHVQTRHPICPRYVFVAADTDNRWLVAAFKTNYVRAVLAVDTRPYAIDAETIAGLETGRPGPRAYKPKEEKKAAYNTARAIDPFSPVRVDAGPLRGLYCAVETLTDSHLRIAHDMLGKKNFQWLRLDDVSQPS